MKKKLVQKNEKLETLKKTWIYPVSLILIVLFSAVLVQRSQIKAQKITEPKAEVKAEVVEVQKKNSPTSPSSVSEVVEEKIIEQRATEAPVSKNQTVTSTAGNVTPVVQAPIVVKKTAKVAIANLGTFNVEVKEGDNAFEILKRAAQEHNFALDYSVDPRWGAFLNGIGGVQNNFKTGTYWTLYYNGKAAEVGASQISINKNDITEWRYESWNF